MDKNENIENILYDNINNIDDLSNLIMNNIRESEILEYKSANKKFTDKNKNDIPKDVSAMANSSGGTIIYGIKTDSKDKSNPIEIEGTDITNYETFDRVVNSQIKKEIKGIKKKMVGNCIIVYIPKSYETPHQSLVDKKYYRRSLTESIPMEHDIVELHFGRRLGPILSLKVNIVENEKISKLKFNENNFSESITLRLSVNNSGQRVGKYVEIVLLFPSSDKIKIINDNKLSNIDNLYKGQNIQARQYTQNIGVFHPLTDKRFSDIAIEISKDYFNKIEPRESLITWNIFADEMQPMSGIYFIN